MSDPSNTPDPQGAQATYTMWEVTGIVHLAGGFTFRLPATDQRTAEKLAERILTSLWEDDPTGFLTSYDITLQETCINSTQEIPPNG